MRTEFPRDLWEQLRDEDFDLRSDYSGRAMYGRTCIGVIGSVTDLMKFIARVATWNTDGTQNSPLGEDLVEDLANAARSDSMGFDTIFYFPGVVLREQ